MEIYDKYQEQSGTLAKSFIDKIVNSPNYDKYPRKVKEDLIKGMFDASRKITRVKLGIEFEKGLRDIEDIKKSIIER